MYQPRTVTGAVLAGARAADVFRDFASKSNRSFSFRRAASASALCACLRACAVASAPRLACSLASVAARRAFASSCLRWNAASFSWSVLSAAAAAASAFLRARSSSSRSSSAAASASACSCRRAHRTRSHRVVNAAMCAWTVREKKKEVRVLGWPYLGAPLFESFRSFLGFAALCLGLSLCLGLVGRLGRH